MKRRKNLERAVVLGLLLSTSVYGSAWADIYLIEGENAYPEGWRIQGVTETYNGEGKNITIKAHNDSIWLGASLGIWSVGSALHDGDATINVGSLNIDARNYIGDNAAVKDEISAGIIAGTAKVDSSWQGSDSNKAIVDLNSDNTVAISTLTRNGANSYGIYSKINGNVDINSQNGDIIINSSKGLSSYKHEGLIIKEYYIQDADYANSKAYGLNAESGVIDLDANNITVNAFIKDDSDLSAYENYGVYNNALQESDIYAASNTNGTINLSTGTTDNVKGVISLSATANKGNAYGLYTQNGKQNSVSGANKFVVNAESVAGNAYGIYADNDKNNEYNNAVNYISGNSTSGEAYGIYAVNGSEVNIISSAADEYGHGNTITSNKVGIQADGSVLNITAQNGGNTLVSGTENGMIVNGSIAAGYNVTVVGDLILSSENGHALNIKEGASMYVDGNQYFDNTITIEGNANEEITGDLISNGVIGSETSPKDAVVVKSDSALTVGGNVNITATGTGLNVDNSSITVNDTNGTESNNIKSTAGAVVAENKATVTLNGMTFITSGKDSAAVKADSSTFTSNGSNIIHGGTYAVQVTNGSEVNLGSKDAGYNILDAGNVDTYGYGDAAVIDAIDSKVTLEAAGDNTIHGAIYAQNTEVAMNGENNYISSVAHSLKNTTDVEKYDKVISALYARETESDVNITSNGGTNKIQSYAQKGEDERTVWAQRGADITINGQTIITASLAEINTTGEEITLGELNGNSNGVAITAGTGYGSELDDAVENGELPAVTDNSTVTLNYAGNSRIEGDIAAGWGGVINVSSDNNAGSNLYFAGNALAGNGGSVTVDLGNGGVWYGRADDYGDADIHSTFFNPAFSNNLIEGGEVNLTMGDGSKWYVQGQSWITSINTVDANDTLIDLVSANTNHNETAHALTIGTLNGDTRFHMSLDANRDVSDMLYIKKANGSYQISLEDTVKVDEIGANGLRFATVGAGSNVSFEVGSYDNGAFNVEYDVISETYSSTDEENKIYNSTEGGNASIEKPGSESVDNFFNPDNTKNKKQLKATNKIMLLAEDSSVNSTNNENTITEHTNFLLNGDVTTNLSDAGKTMLNMSRANYSNAIYMDRLNKRLGEARYINGEENEGMWVRIRHDRIGKEDAYRSQNTMYELGYDVKQECDNGERRVGFAVDYMHGDTGYSDVAGKGELDRYGLWLYDTWMGDKGHYVDYVAKWGHLDNDFEVYTMSKGKKVTGDYSNNVFSVSAEYGRKKDIGSDWYFEPQAQLQLARVTGAEYTTSQGTKVSVDGINSLIGRAGFRIGKDFGEQKQSTVYIKADVLHEFLGDQDVSVMDDTTNGRYVGIGYENEGTWYDVGFGFATQTGKNSYAFMDFEKSFGHDNDETYQINAGVQWTF